MPERRLDTRTVFEGKILTVRVDEIEIDGHRGSREVVETAGAVGVVCVHDGDIWLVRQHRYPTGKDLLEIPAGKLDGDEDPVACAERELVEEIGLRPRSLSHVVSYFASPGFTDHELHIFYTDDVGVEEPDPEPGEVLELVRHPVDDVKGLLRSGDVHDAKTLIGLTFLALGELRS